MKMGRSAWMMTTWLLACGTNVVQPDASTTDASTTDVASDTSTCSTTTCNGACVNVATDPKNCGTCGHACAACAGGACTSAQLVAPNGQIGAVAADDTTAYFLTYTPTAALFSCALTGCANTPTKLTTPTNQPYSQGDLVAGGGYVFWVTSNNSASCPTAGCPISSCSSTGCASPTNYETSDTRLAIDATSLYWIHGGTLYSCAIGATCASAATLTTNVGAYKWIALTAKAVVLASASDVVMCAKTGCTSTTPVATGTISGVAGGDHWVGLTDSASITVVDADALDAGKKTIAPTAAAPSKPAGDATHVYWANTATASPGPLERCAWGGCASTPELIVPMFDNPPTGSAFALSTTFYVWVTSGTLWVGPK